MRWDDEVERFDGGAGLTVFVSLIVALGVSFGLYFKFERGALARASATVPALVGMSLDEARVAARARGMVLVITGSRSDRLVPRGAIAMQRPLAGAAAPGSGKVNATLSEGSPTTPAVAPDSGNAVDDARPASDAAVAASSASPSPAGAAEAVAATQGAVKVPRVTRGRVGLARRKLARAGLRLGRVRYVTDEDRMDRSVLSQRPKAGARVPAGTAVELVVNRTR